MISVELPTSTPPQSEVELNQVYRNAKPCSRRGEQEFYI